MDRKEAINILSLRRQNAIGTLGNLPREANDTAINVLVNEISAYDMAIEALKDPQVGGWIPVSERLPKDCGEDWVLVQIREKDCGFLWIPRVGEERRGKWWLADDEEPLEDMFEVIAWQPLPEPYKESEGK